MLLSGALWQVSEAEMQVVQASDHHLCPVTPYRTYLFLLSLQICMDILVCVYVYTHMNVYMCARAYMCICTCM